MFVLRDIPPTAGMPVSPVDLISGAFTRGSFEAELATYLKVPHVKLFSSGTTALWIAFETLKRCSQRRRIILPAYTCPLVAIAAHAAGLEIVLCDTVPDGTDLDPVYLASICDESVLAIVPTDIGGLPTVLGDISHTAKKAGAYIVLDSAQSFGASRNESPALADFAVMSFAAGKGLTLLDGGILTSSESSLMQEASKIHDELVSELPLLKLNRQLLFAGYSLFYNPFGLRWIYGTELREWIKKGDYVSAVGDHFELDQPHYRFADWRRQVGVHLLRGLPRFVESNRQRALARVKTLSSETGVTVLTEAPGSKGSWPFITVVCNTQKSRDEIMKELWTSGLGVTRLFIHELSGYEYLKAVVPQAEMPEARSFAERSFTITNSQWLSDEDFASILKVIRVHCPAPSVVSA